MQRKESLDIAKGIGITAVVIGHVTTVDLLREVIFLWHMPLFFFLSGYLFKPRRDVSSVAKAKALSLLLPYVSFLTLLSLPYLANIWVHGGFSELFAAITKLAYGGRDLGGWFGVFWFVTCLYFTQIGAAFLASIFTKNGLTLLAALSLCIAYGLQYFAPNLRSPLNVAITVFALPIFLVGHMAAGKNPPKFLILIALLGMGCVLAGILPSMDMKAQDYGLPVITLAFALASVVAVLQISNTLASTLTGRGFAKLGSASLVIMFTHQAVQLIALWKLRIESPSLRILMALAFGLIAHELLQRNATTRTLFLGNARSSRESSASTAQRI